MPNVRGHYAKKLSAWRRMALASWAEPRESTVYGMLEINAAPSLGYLNQLRERTQERVTITHVVTKALAHALAKHPECNAYVRRGRIFVRDDVDILLLVALPPGNGGRQEGADLGGIKLSNADQKSLLEVAAAVEHGAVLARLGDEGAFGTAKSVLRWLPPALAKWGVKLVTALQYEANLDLSRFGVPRDSFGGALVTSVGMLGIRRALGPLVPSARFAVVLVVGEIEDKPVVEDGKIVIRPILPITTTFDHRVIDGYHGGKLVQTFTEVLSNPAAFFE